MTRIRLLTTLLAGLFILETDVLWAAQQEESTPATREQKQLPPTPGEGRQVYIPGIKPFLWIHHGASPYFPALDRDALVRLSQNENLVQDLTSMQQAFTKPEADFIKNALAHATDPDSTITEVTLPVDTPIQRMRLKTGVEPMVILKGQPEPSWQIILPPELGSKVIWIPKICGNICLSPFPAQTQTFVFKTEVKERETIKERVVEKPVYIPRPVYYPVDRPVYIDRPIYQESESSCSRCGKKCKIIIGVLAGAGVGAGVYFGTRGHKNQAVVPYKPPGGGGGVN